MNIFIPQSSGKNKNFDNYFQLLTHPVVIFQQNNYTFKIFNTC